MNSVSDTTELSGWMNIAESAGPQYRHMYDLFSALIDMRSSYETDLNTERARVSNEQFTLNRNKD